MNITRQHPNNIDAKNTRMRVNQWLEAVLKRDKISVMAMLHRDLRLTTPFQDEAIEGTQNVMQTMYAFVQSVDNFQYGQLMAKNSKA
jgi:hypothetical protein